MSLDNRINEHLNQMKKLLLLFLLLPTLSFAETYLCITDAADGVFYNDATKKFQGTSFGNNNARKYLLKNKNDEWKFSYFGEADFEVPCEEGKAPTDGSKLTVHRAFCGILAGQFVMDILKMRFAKTHWDGFENEDKNTATPSVEVGSCSKI